MSDDDLTALSREWNDAGRAYFTELSARLAKFYGGDAEVDLGIEDPRTEEMGDRVMRAVIALHARGESGRARELFDPAYGPLMPWIKQSTRSLSFVTILGPDELLVRRGNAWQPDGVTFHLKGSEARPIDDVLGVCRSRNRKFLVLARAAGLEVRDARAGIEGLQGPPIATMAWPHSFIFTPRGSHPPLDAFFGASDDAAPFAVEQLAVSDDGMRIVVSCHRQGILLATREEKEGTWTLLWPDARRPYHLDEQTLPRAGDMTHVAISRDGQRLAWGGQDTSHFLAELGPDGDPTWYATVYPLSEYPNHACFSDDGRHVALSSCHFYRGLTVGFDWDGHRGVTVDPDEASGAMPCVDSGLRVYAACWLDAPVVDAIVGHGREPESSGAFALAGSGIFRVCAPDGAIEAVQGFGASAGSIDYCPESKRLAIASYSGFVHLYDPFEEELPGRIDGFRPRRELARWILWEHLPNGPLRW